MNITYIYLPGSKAAATALASQIKTRPKAVGVSFFPDGDARVRLPRLSPKTRPIVVAPPSGDWAEIGLLLMTIRALKEAGYPAEIFFPMMPYGRADKAEVGETRTAMLFTDLISAAGAKAVVVVAPHTEKPLKNLACPVLIIDPLATISAAVCRNWKPDTIFAPDRGALPRSRQVAKELNINNIGYCQKIRRAKSVEIKKIGGRIGQRVLLVDDIIATGATLFAAARKLKQMGVPDIRAAVVHGVFADNALKELRNSCIKIIGVSDTLFLKNKHQKIQVIPVLPLIGKARAAI